MDLSERYWRARAILARAAGRFDDAADCEEIAHQRANDHCPELYESRGRTYAISPIESESVSYNVAERALQLCRYPL